MDPQDQRKILEGICYIALTVDEKIQFVGIIEGSGKLLVGKHRQAKYNLFAFYYPYIKLV
jgi:hypothetical protein